MDFFRNEVKQFTVSFEQLNVSLMNKSITFHSNLEQYCVFICNTAMRMWGYLTVKLNITIQNKLNKFEVKYDPDLICEIHPFGSGKILSTPTEMD